MRRLELQALLEGLLESEAVYFQPPPSVKMRYPAIVYERDAASEQYANNNPYLRTKRYQLTVIDYDPDSVIPGKVGTLPTSSFERHFNADGLNHDVYSLYF